MWTGRFLVAFPDLDTASPQGGETLALNQVEFPFNLGQNWANLENKNMAVSHTPELATLLVYLTH